jgi:hypothetical protein
MSDLQGGMSAVKPAYDIRLALPTNLTYRKKLTVVSKGPVDLLAGIGPMSVEKESGFMPALIADLDKNMCLQLDPLPGLARDTELQAVSPPPSDIGGGQPHLEACLPHGLPAPKLHQWWLAGWENWGRGPCAGPVRSHR